MMCFGGHEILFEKLRERNDFILVMDHNPLLHVAISYFRETNPNISLKDFEIVKRAFEMFLKGDVDYSNCKSYISKYSDSSESLDRIKAVLEVGNSPIPSNDKEDDDSHPESSRKKANPWTTYEDQRLLAGVHKYGIDNWAMISLFVGNSRTRSQCAQRWNRVLDPRISKEQWSKEEDIKLINLVSLHGEKGWTQIAAGMGNRSDVQCRYHFSQIQKESKNYKNNQKPEQSQKQIQFNQIFQNERISPYNSLFSLGYQAERNDNQLQNFNMFVENHHVAPPKENFEKPLPKPDTPEKNQSPFSLTTSIEGNNSTPIQFNTFETFYVPEVDASVYRVW